MVGGPLLALAMMLHSPLFNIACWWGVLFVWQCLYAFASRLLRPPKPGRSVLVALSPLCLGYHAGWHMVGQCCLVAGAGQ
jgi:hypothetical protein